MPLLSEAFLAALANGSKYRTDTWSVALRLSSAESLTSAEYQRHWGPLIVWLGASGVMSGSWVWGPGVACLGATWGS